MPSVADSRPGFGAVPEIGMSQSRWKSGPFRAAKMVALDQGFRACVRTVCLTAGSAPLGAAENSPARHEALRAEGKCRVSEKNKSSPALAGLRAF